MQYYFKYEVSGMKKRDSLLVEVYMITYNHEKYVEKAIESVLMQKVNFKYRIVIADDCSTDDTVKILKKYKKKYPDKIKLILRDKNVGMRENSRLLREELVAPYLAPLEGDDYWLDKNKLQKQVDFLENNSDYSCYCSSVYIVDKDGKRSRELEKRFTNYCYDEDKEFTLVEAVNYVLPGQTATLLYRNFYKGFDIEQKKLYNSCRANGDQKLALVNAIKGKIFCSKDPMAVHRKVFDSGSSWSAKINDKNMAKYHFDAICDLEILIYKLFSKNINMQLAKNARFDEAIRFYRKKKNLGNLKIEVKENKLVVNALSLAQKLRFDNIANKVKLLYKKIGYDNLEIVVNALEDNEKEHNRIAVTRIIEKIFFKKSPT